MEQNSRTNKLMRNTIWAVVGYSAYVLAGFVSRTVFINQLGTVYSGISSYFSNIMMLFSLAEMGFSAAIGFHLYEPVAKQNKRKIAALIALFEKVYRWIALFIFVLGMLVVPFSHYFVNADERVPYLRFYFFLYVIKTVTSYCYASRGNLILLHQDGYINNIVLYFSLTVQVVLQIFALQWSHGFFWFLILQILGVFVSNVILTHKATKMYPYLDEYKDEKVSKTEIQSIIHYIKACSIDKIALAIRTATDNILVSKCISVAITGLIDNYMLLLVSVNSIIQIFVANTLPAIGNLNVVAKKEQRYQTLQDFMLVTSWIYGVCTTCMACLFTPFILIWLGDAKFLLSDQIVFLLLFNFFINGMTSASYVYFTTLGLVRKVPWMNGLNVVLNLTISLSLVSSLGVVGVYIGTIVSYLLSQWWICPWIVLKEEFDSNFAPYYKKYFLFFVVNGLACAGSVFVCGQMGNAGFFGLLLKGIVCLVVFHVIFCVSLMRTKEFKTVWHLGKQYVLSVVKK